MRADDFSTRKNLEQVLQIKDNTLADKGQKTYEFWLKKDNKWNVPSFASKKIHKFHHKFHEDYLKSLPKNHEKQDKTNPYLYNKQTDYKFFVKNKRKEAQRRLAERKKQRFVLQEESLQMIPDAGKHKEMEEKIKNLSYSDRRELIMKGSGARTMLKKQPGNLWNDFNNKCDKVLGLYLRPIMLKNEDNAVESMKKKIKKTQKEDFYKGIYEKVKHDVIRERTFRSKSEQKTKNGGKIERPYMHFYKKRMKSLIQNRKKNGEDVDDDVMEVIGQHGSSIGDSTFVNNLNNISVNFQFLFRFLLKN